MNKILNLFALCLFIGGCATTQLSDLQRRSIEAKDLEGTFDNAYKATLAVLQDRGFIIDHTDYDAGVIKATTGKNFQFFKGVVSRNVSVTIEQFGENRVKERITFLENVSVNAGYYGTSEKSKIIDDPRLLQEIYDAIQKEMFVRKNLNK